MPPVRPAVADMSGYSPGEQPAAGGRVIKLNTNENPYPPGEAVMRAIRAVDAESLRRYPDPTAMAFRAAAARRHGVSPDMVLAGNGSDDILTILLRTFVDAGGRVAYPSPTYSLYATLAQIQGAGVAEVPWRDGWRLPADALAEVGAPLTFVVNPNAPSGTWVEPGELADLARRLRGALVIDEAYADFAGEDCAGLIADCPNVIVSRSLSKGFGLAGLRFGYALARPEVVAEMAKVKDSYNCDAVAIAAAAAALDDVALAERTWRQVAGDRDALAGDLAELGFDVTPSRANFLLARPPGDDREAGRLYRGLKSQGILVRHFDKPGLADRLRITVGTPAENAALLEGLKVLMRKELAA